MSIKEHEVTVPERLKVLHAKSQLKWDQLAKILDVSASMLHQVKRGHRNLSEQAIHRLGEAERKLETAEEDETIANLRGIGIAAFGTDIFEDESTRKRGPHDAHIRMRLDCLLDMIETYDQDQLELARKSFAELADKDKQFGKIFGEVASVIAHVWLRRMSNKTDPKITADFDKEPGRERPLDSSSVGKTDLTGTSKYRNTTGEMKLTLKRLLNDVRRLTKPAGMKAKLADALDVPQSRVSEWLSGKHEPSGEMTMRIFNWVEDPDRKSKKARPCVEARPGGRPE
jgi:transcriptional regulator with XRE-family HTH domain